jgi:hypothetical protein
MKNWLSLILFLSLIFLAYQFSISSPLKTKHSVKFKKLENSNNYAIDLKELGALRKDTAFIYSFHPSISDLMRDSYYASFKYNPNDSAFITKSKPIINKNGYKKLNELSAKIQHKLRFSAFFCILLLILIVIFSYTSPLLRRTYRMFIYSLTPFGLGRIVLILWIIGLLLSIIYLSIINGQIPKFGLSIPLFFGIVFLTFIVSFLIGFIGYKNENDLIYKRKRKSRGLINDLFKFNGTISFFRIQYFFISILNLLLLLLPVWKNLVICDSPSILLITQILSSMIYVGHKAAHLQSIHSLILKKIIRP